MNSNSYVSSDTIRQNFSSAMSGMYRKEVPAYGTLIDLVADINKQTLEKNTELKNELKATEGIERISEERHGAIRLGTAKELVQARRIFAVMGMYPVGYYDLSIAHIPVHSTAFRPISKTALSKNPFRIFTSLLRLDLIQSKNLQEEARSILQKREIFTEEALSLLEKFEQDEGLNEQDTERFVSEVLKTFQWNITASVSKETYQSLHSVHPLIADIVSFQGPHINHLTPRTLDIDQVQQMMPEKGIAPKAVIEGPPKRDCPILLRQTSFKALEEKVMFQTNDDTVLHGTHTARFGEIEHRGIALTPKGKQLYDLLLDITRSIITPKPDGSNAEEYVITLNKTFTSFPDDWNSIRKAGLGYFFYSLTNEGNNWKPDNDHKQLSIEEYINLGIVQANPIIYEDFLPVSAAGIFQSNLGDDTQKIEGNSNQISFENDLGTKVLNEFEYYAAMEKDSLTICLEELGATKHFKQIQMG